MSSTRSDVKNARVGKQPARNREANGIHDDEPERPKDEPVGSTPA
jgi:hypothetical protein